MDEFAIRMIMTYKDKEFKSVSSGDLGIEEENKDNTESEEKDKELFDYMKEILSNKVKDVRISKRLKTHPVCFATDGEVTIEMEKILKNMPGNENIKADKILEINVNHEVFQSLKDAFEKEDKEKLNLYTNLLYNQALLIEGLPVDPIELSNDICKIMV